METFGQQKEKEAHPEEKVRELKLLVDDLSRDDVDRNEFQWYEDIVDFVSDLDKKYTREVVAKTMLFHALVGSTYENETASGVDLPEGEIEGFIRDKFAAMQKRRESESLEENGQS